MQVNICGKCQPQIACENQDNSCPYIFKFSGNLEEFERFIKFLEEKKQSRIDGKEAS
jgi:hypothetical protein